MRDEPRFRYIVVARLAFFTGRVVTLAVWKPSKPVCGCLPVR